MSADYYSYKGDMTFVLSSGLRVTIPNHQLLGPDVSLDESGKAVIVNDTVVELMLNSLQDINKDDMPLLGQTFLSSAYVFVDQDANRFTIWQSNATTDQEIIPYSRGNACAALATKPNSSEPLPPSPTRSDLAEQANRTEVSQKQSGKLASPAIAGISIGAAVVILASIALAVFCLKKKSTHTAKPLVNSSGSSHFETHISANPQEMQETPIVYEIGSHHV